VNCKTMFYILNDGLISASIPEQSLIRFTRVSLATFVATPAQITSLLLIMQGSIIQPSLSIIPLAKLTIDCFAAALCLMSLVRSLQGRRGWQQLSRAQQFTPFAMVIIFGLARLSSLIWFPIVTFCSCITGVFSSFIWWRYIGELYANRNHVLRAVLQIS